MAKKKNKRKSSFGTPTIMKFVRLGALVAPAAAIAVGAASPENKLKDGIRKYTGFDLNSGSFSFAQLAQGWGPYAASVAVTYGIPKLAGIIRGM